ncbi:MAG: hypothetical protein ACT4QC_22610 [Planctomycetaceae bacterium]
MTGTWASSASRTLLTWRAAGGGWRYRPDGEAYVEPTALAMLALKASGEVAPPEAGVAVAESARWLAGLQQPDGSVGLSPALPAPHWTTPLAILAWAASGGCDDELQRAVNWLGTQRGETAFRPADSPFGHDATLTGWSWVEGTHSWLEPTAVAILALARAGAGESQRVAQGRNLIRDRAIRAGGWNYGNSRVFDTDLRPQPAPTGLALLALAGADDRDRPCIDRGCRYLEQALPTTKAAQSLGWGLLGLAAWGRRPADCEAWLAGAAERAPLRSDRVVQLAYLLLAAGDRGLDVLGVASSVNQEAAP